MSFNLLPSKTFIQIMCVYTVRHINVSVVEVFNILAKSSSCGNILCSYQHYQPGKITLQVSVLMIEYFRDGSRVCSLMQMEKLYILLMKR